MSGPPAQPPPVISGRSLLKSTTSVGAWTLLSRILGLVRDTVYAQLFGATFLMPDDPAANIIMICTGTGSAPFRGFTERRRRAMPDAPGRLLLFFGARRPEELPYFGPLQKVPEKLLGKYFCYSRVPDQPRVYVQDRIRSEMAQIAALLRDDKTHVYICGLKGMESGVDEAFADACRAASIDWSALKPVLRDGGRYHVETY